MCSDNPHSHLMCWNTQVFLLFIFMSINHDSKMKTWTWLCPIISPLWSSWIFLGVSGCTIQQALFGTGLLNFFFFLLVSAHHSEPLKGTTGVRSKGFNVISRQSLGKEGACVLWLLIAAPFLSGARARTRSGLERMFAILRQIWPA